MNFRKVISFLILIAIILTTQFIMLSQKNNGNQKKKIADIPTPIGYERLNTESNSFASYLRSIQLSDDNTVYLYNNTPKPSQNLHYAVLEIDIGKSDLQQCADAIMRLRGEYLYSQQKYEKIHFNFLSDGKPRYFKDYAVGDYSYKKFRSYMNWVFAYANTASLIKELKKVDISQMQIGDILIQTGNPYGHAVIVVDMAVNPKTNEKIFLIAQSFMPAQSIHILKNFNDQTISPWYKLPTQGNIVTPEWTFTTNDLYRFVD